MWGELKEVLLAFAGALVAIWAVVTGISLWSRLASDGDGEPKRETRDRDRHVPIGSAFEGTGHTHSPDVGEGEDVAADPAVSGPPCIHKIFIASDASAPMRQVADARADARRGLRGDRYAEGCGFWSEKDECEVTFIAQEDIDAIAQSTGLRLQDGEHRRNIVTRNIRMRELVGKRFQIGDAQFAYDRPRPPCLHLQTITEPGMAQALVRGSGVCVRCTRSGTVREGDRIRLMDTSVSKLLVAVLRQWWRGGS